MIHNFCALDYSDGLFSAQSVRQTLTLGVSNCFGAAIYSSKIYTNYIESAMRT